MLHGNWGCHRCKNFTLGRQILPYNVEYLQVLCLSLDRVNRARHCGPGVLCLHVPAWFQGCFIRKGMCV